MVQIIENNDITVQSDIVKNLVKVENNQVVVSSRDIAEHFEKLHKNVLASIREILAAEISATNLFFETTYENRGKQYVEYLMNRDGFTLLAMGFTGAKALQWKLRYINAFNDMEKKLKIIQKLDSYMIEDPIERAKRWIEEEQVRQELQKANELMKPKAEFYDTVMQSDTSIQIGETAKVLKLGIGRNKLFAFLRNKKVLQKNNVPYQKYVDAEYFELSESFRASHGKLVVDLTTYVTQKGVDFIRKLLREENIK